MGQLQEQVPESDSGKKTYAISLFKEWDGNMMMCAKNYASFYGYNELGFVLSKADGSDIQDISDDNGQYVRALRFLFHANQKGLVDPDSASQNYDTLEDIYHDGQILTSMWFWQGRDIYDKEVDKTEGKTHKALGKGFFPALIEDMERYSNGYYSGGNTKLVLSGGTHSMIGTRSCCQTF